MELKFLFVFLFLPSTTLGYFITVEAYDEHCFYDKVTSGTKMGLLFEVAEGGFRDIDVTVSNYCKDVQVCILQLSDITRIPLYQCVQMTPFVLTSFISPILLFLKL